MADIGGAATRLRRTFRYPAEPDDADNSEPEALDEEEQDDLINNLAAKNTSFNATYTRILIALPLLTTVAYIPTLLRPSASTSRLPSLLAITSLFSTAFILYSLPPTTTGFDVLDRRRKTPASSLTRSPLETWLPHLNLALVVMLILLGFISSPEASGKGYIGLSNLPAVVYAVIIAAKLIMGSVDPEAELTALRYEYKGA